MVRLRCPAFLAGTGEGARRCQNALASTCGTSNPPLPTPPNHHTTPVRRRVHDKTHILIIGVVVKNPALHGRHCETGCGDGVGSER